MWKFYLVIDKVQTAVDRAESWKSTEIDCPSMKTDTPELSTQKNFHSLHSIPRNRPIICIRATCFWMC